MSSRVAPVLARHKATQRMARRTVAGLYRGLLLRKPDGDGFKKHVSALLDGEDPRLVIEAILMSPEFAQTFPEFSERYLGSRPSRPAADGAQDGTPDGPSEPTVEETTTRGIVAEAGRTQRGRRAVSEHADR